MYRHRDMLPLRALGSDMTALLTLNHEPLVFQDPD